MEPCIGTILMAGTKIAEYFGLIDSVSVDVKKLLHKDFQSAITSLKYAMNASDFENQKINLMDARKSFIDATSVEDNENLVSALAGLAMCQFLLGDRANAQLTLSKIEDVQLSTSKKVEAYSKELIVETAKSMIIPFYYWTSMYKTLKEIKKGNVEVIDPVQKRKDTLEKYKQLVKSIIKVQ